jgi:hypothetical protein
MEHNDAWPTFLIIFFLCLKIATSEASAQNVRLYVDNSEGDDVTVIDLKTLNTVDDIRLADKVHGLAIDDSFSCWHRFPDLNARLLRTYCQEQRIPGSVRLASMELIHTIPPRCNFARWRATTRLLAIHFREVAPSCKMTDTRKPRSRSKYRSHSGSGDIAIGIGVWLEGCQGHS